MIPTSCINPEEPVPWITFFPLLPSRCITCTARRTWSSAGYRGTSFFGAWSHGPRTLWLLRPVPQQAARARLLSILPPRQLHLLHSLLQGLFSSAQTKCLLPGALPPSPMGLLENMSWLGEVWRTWGGEEVMRRTWKEERWVTTWFWSYSSINKSDFAGLHINVVSFSGAFPRTIPTTSWHPLLHSDRAAPLDAVWVQCPHLQPSWTHPQPLGNRNNQTSTSSRPGPSNSKSPSRPAQWGVGVLDSAPGAQWDPSVVQDSERQCQFLF